MRVGTLLAETGNSIRLRIYAMPPLSPPNLEIARAASSQLAGGNPRGPKLAVGDRRTHSDEALTARGISPKSRAPAVEEKPQ